MDCLRVYDDYDGYDGIKRRYTDDLEGGGDGFQRRYPSDYPMEPMRTYPSDYPLEPVRTYPIEPLEVKKKNKSKKLGCAKRKGRHSIERKFPEVGPTLTNLLVERGFNAQRSRAVPTGQSGMSLQECRDGLLLNVEGLQEAHPNLGKLCLRNVLIL